MAGIVSFDHGPQDERARGREGGAGQAPGAPACMSLPICRPDVSIGRSVGDGLPSHPRGDPMRRREFIVLLGGAVLAPLAARAQQSGTSYRVSFLALVPGEDTTLMPALLERLRELGYNEG